MVCFSSSLSTLIIRSTSRKTTTTCAYTQQQRQRLHYFVHTQSFQHRNFSSTKIPDSLSSLHNDSNEIDDDDDEIIENHHQKQQKQKQQKKDKHRHSRSSKRRQIFPTESYMSIKTCSRSI